MLLMTSCRIVGSIGTAATKGQGIALKERDPGLPFAGHEGRLWAGLAHIKALKSSAHSGWYSLPAIQPSAPVDPLLPGAKM